MQWRAPEQEPRPAQRSAPGEAMAAPFIAGPLAHDAAARGGEEVDEGNHLRAVGAHRLETLQGLGHPESVPVDEPVGAVQLLDGRGLESGPAEALAVDAAGRGGVAARRHVGAVRPLNTTEPMAVNACRPIRAELVHDGERAKHHEVVDGHVAGEGRAVGHHRVRADPAVVRDVHVGHDPVVVAEAGDSPRRPASRGGRCSTRG